MLMKQLTGGTVGGGGSIDPITGTWTRSTNLSIPTSGKAIGFYIETYSNSKYDEFYCLDGTNNVQRIGQNGRMTNWTTCTFGNSSIDFNEYYTSLGDVPYTGYVIY